LGASGLHKNKPKGKIESIGESPSLKRSNESFQNKTVKTNTQIIAIASGKGGVGKSTVSSNLAIALSKKGSKVGLLDADIYGPSIPRMFGVPGQSVTSNDGNSFEPIESNGIQLMSIGFVQTNNDAMIWRGPMLSQAINQLLFQTNWKDLEYLIIDLPPGTGDAQLTISQKANLTGAILVTTPQHISLIDVEKSLLAFRKLDIEVLGLIENMSYFNCADCGKDHYIFGEGNMESFCEKHGVDLISNLPISPELASYSDDGTLFLNFENLPVVSKKYQQIADYLITKMSSIEKNDSLDSIPVVTE